MIKIKLDDKMQIREALAAYVPSQYFAGWQNGELRFRSKKDGRRFVVWMFSAVAAFGDGVRVKGLIDGQEAIADVVFCLIFLDRIFEQLN
jgi:hypothetical protein